MTAINLLSSINSYLSSPLALATAALQKKEVSQLGKDLSSGSLLLAKNDAQKALKAFNSALGFNSTLDSTQQRTVNNDLTSIMSSLQAGNTSAAVKSYNELGKTLSNSGAISTMSSPTLAAAAMAGNTYVTGTTINTAVIDALANSSSNNNTSSGSAFVYNAVGTATALSYQVAGTILNAKA